MRYIWMAGLLLAAGCSGGGGAEAGDGNAAGVPGAPTPLATTIEAAAAGPSIPAGDYECWYFGEPRLLLNFTVTGPGQYRASDGSTSSFTYDPGSGKMVFSGYLAESMPEGFETIYHEPQGTPTVSFRSARGSEASFCEKRK